MISTQAVSIPDFVTERDSDLIAASWILKASSTTSADKKRPLLELIRSRKRNDVQQYRHRGYLKRRIWAQSARQKKRIRFSISVASSFSKPRCRKHRRRRYLFRSQAFVSEGPESEVSTKDKRKLLLSTHLWHAKRFIIEDTSYGWKIPLRHSGRGLKALSRFCKHRCFVQDRSYYRTIRLVGDGITLIEMMNHYLVSFNEIFQFIFCIHLIINVYIVEC